MQRLKANKSLVTVAICLKLSPGPWLSVGRCRRIRALICREFRHHDSCARASVHARSTPLADGVRGDIPTGTGPDGVRIVYVLGAATTAPYTHVVTGWPPELLRWERLQLVRCHSRQNRRRRDKHRPIQREVISTH